MKTRCEFSFQHNAALSPHPAGLCLTPTKLFFAQAGEDGKTLFVARGYGVHGRSWGAFCVDVVVDARVLVCR